MDRPGLGRVFSSEGEASEATQEVDAGPPGEDGEGDLRGKNSGHGQDAIEFCQPTGHIRRLARRDGAKGFLGLWFSTSVILHKPFFACTSQKKKTKKRQKWECYSMIALISNELQVKDYCTTHGQSPSHPIQTFTGYRSHIQSPQLIRLTRFSTRRASADNVLSFNE